MYYTCLCSYLRHYSVTVVVLYRGERSPHRVSSLCIQVYIHIWVVHYMYMYSHCFTSREQRAGNRCNQCTCLTLVNIESITEQNKDKLGDGASRMN